MHPFIPPRVTGIRVHVLDDGVSVVLSLGSKLPCSLVRFYSRLSLKNTTKRFGFPLLTMAAKMSRHPSIAMVFQLLSLEVCVSCEVRATPSIGAQKRRVVQSAISLPSHFGDPEVSTRVTLPCRAAARVPWLSVEAPRCSRFGPSWRPRLRRLAGAWTLPTGSG